MFSLFAICLLLLTTPAFAQIAAPNPTWANPTGGPPADVTRVLCSVNAGPYTTACEATPSAPGATMPTKCDETKLTYYPIRNADGTTARITCHVKRVGPTGESAPMPVPDFSVLTSPPGAVGSVTWTVIYKGSVQVPQGPAEE